jgi:hypothetical protein
LFTGGRQPGSGPVAVFNAVAAEIVPDEPGKKSIIFCDFAQEAPECPLSTASANPALGLCNSSADDVGAARTPVFIIFALAGLDGAEPHLIDTTLHSTGGYEPCAVLVAKAVPELAV